MQTCTTTSNFRHTIKHTKSSETRDHHDHKTTMTTIGGRPSSPSVTALSLLAVLLLLVFPTSSAFASFHPNGRSKAATTSLSVSNGENMSELKRILVTGANTGIGLALTKQLVKDHGCHVYLGSRSAERGSNAVEEVKRSAGDNVELLTIDVSSDCSVQSAAASLSKSLGNDKLYAIVNNAGTGFAHGTSPPEILDTNTRGPRRVIDAFLPLLDSDGGRIVNVGSGAGPMFFDMLSTREQARRYVGPMSEEEIEKEIGVVQRMNDGFAAYAGSKSLLACYTMALANQHPNLSCSIITPGWIMTNMTRGQGASKTPEEGTVSLKKALFGDLPGSGYFWGSDGLRSPLHYLRNPGEPEYDGADPGF